MKCRPDSYTQANLRPILLPLSAYIGFLNYKGLASSRLATVSEDSNHGLAHFSCQLWQAPLPECCGALHQTGCNHYGWFTCMWWCLLGFQHQGAALLVENLPRNPARLTWVQEEWKRNFFVNLLHLLSQLYRNPIATTLSMIHCYKAKTFYELWKSFNVTCWKDLYCWHKKATILQVSLPAEISSAHTCGLITMARVNKSNFACV